MPRRAKRLSCLAALAALTSLAALSGSVFSPSSFPRQGPGGYVAWGWRAASAQTRDSASVFHDTWYQEVVLGQWVQAAERYDDLYYRTPTRIHMAEREKAAYRAGRCLEIIDQTSKAEVAYGYLVNEGIDPSLRARAASHLRRILAAGDPRPARSGEPVTSDAAVSSAIREVLRRGREREVDDAHLRDRLERTRQRVPAADRLTERLRGLGLELRFPEQALVVPGGRAADDGIEDESGDAVPSARPPSVQSLALAERLRDLLEDGARWDSLRATLADRFLRRALAACRNGDVELSRVELAKSLAATPRHKEALEFAWLLRTVRSTSSLAVLAARRERAHHSLRVAWLRRNLALALSRLADLRPASVLERLDDARQEIDRSPDAILSDPELVRLVAKLRHRFVHADGDRFEPALDRLWLRRRSDVRSLIDELGSWTDRSSDEEVYRGEPRWSEYVDAREIVRGELRRLAGQVRKLRRSPKRRAELPLLEEELRWLQHWFPVTSRRLEDLLGPSVEARRRERSAPDGRRRRQ